MVQKITLLASLLIYHFSQPLLVKSPSSAPERTQLLPNQT